MPAYAIVSNYAGKVMDHLAYPRRCRTMSDAELLFTIDDAKAAMRAMPDSPNASYYADEVCYCADELARRSRGGRRRIPTVAEISAAAVKCALDLAGE